MEKKTQILYLIFAVIILIFNLAALGSAWYVIVGDGYATAMGLTEEVTCVDGGSCTTTTYSKLAKDFNDANDSKDANKVKQTAAGGALTIVFLVINLLINLFFIFLLIAFMVPALGDKIPQLTKNPLILSKATFLILLLVPAQILALLFWIALFDYYNGLPSGSSVQGSAGLALTIITILLPPIGFAVAKFVFKDGGIGAPAATTTPAPA